MSDQDKQAGQTPAGTTGVDEAVGAKGYKETAGQGEAVKVNQVGYLSEHAKIAIVAAELPDGASFDVVDAETGATAYSGTLSAETADPASAEKVRQADFSGLTASGLYEVVVDGIGRSYSFEIKERLYGDELVKLLRSYTLQRSATDIDDSVTGLRIPAGHLQDAEAVVYFDDGVSRKGATVDAVGGWYDAGDFGKYISPAAVTTGQMLLSYELNPGAYSVGQMSFPAAIAPDNAAMPDVLEEVKFELAWMLKMQRQDGAVYHKLSGAGWPGFVMPHTDKQTRYLFGLSPFSTAQFAGAMAQAARVYEPFDASFAQRLLEAAERAYAYLEANPGPSFRKDPGQDDGSGAYSKNSDTEERFWAAAELFRTTGRAEYGQAAKRYNNLMSRRAEPITWTDASLLGQWAYYNAADADAGLKLLIAASLKGGANAVVQRVSGDGYRSSLELSDYHWASAKVAAAYGGLLILANEIEPDQAYIDAALDQLHYTFGRTATGYSYATGIGTQYPRNPHHRTGAAAGILFPGLVVGGPNKNGGDPDLDRVKAGLPHAKAYLDVQGSYSSNEYAIDYNAPVVLLAAYFADLDS